MSERTKIQWSDSTWNPWQGCTKRSSGCDNCYAERWGRRFGVEWGHGKTRRKASETTWRQPFGWNKQIGVCDIHHNYEDVICPICNIPTHRRRVFSLSLGDWLDSEVPVEWLARMLDTIRRCDQLTWILCTKRPENFYTRMNDVTDLWSAAHGNKKFGVWDSAGAALNWLGEWLAGNPPPNVWILASAEDQEMTDKRAQELLGIPAAVHGLSLEPLLGPVKIPPGLDWIVLGGETGPNARPCNIGWVRSPVRQGKEAGIPVFVKQLGSRPCVMAPDATGTKYAVPWHLKHPKGADPSEWSEDLRVREWPEGL
jgi:protein gp37